MSTDILRALSGIKREIHEYLDSVETKAVSDEGSASERHAKSPKRQRKDKR